MGRGGAGAGAGAAGAEGWERAVLAGGMLLVTALHFLLLMDSKQGRREKGYPFSASVVIVATEAVKLVLSGAAYLHSVHASAALGQGWADSLRKDLAVHASWRFYLEFAVPAAIYALENNINYWAPKNLKTPMAFVMFGHVETPLVALLSVVVLRRQYSGYQWMAIFLLVDGVMQTEMAICEAEGNGRCSRLADFIVASLSAVMLSRAGAAVAGISTEFLFKRRLDTSIYLQNVQLYSFGVLTNLVILGMREPHRYNEGTFFEGFTPVVGGVILCAALQGMFVSAVIKHMSSLEKCFALGAAIFLNAVISAWNGHFDLNVAFFLGSLVVIVSITLYAMEDMKAKAKGGGAGAGERAGEGAGTRAVAGAEAGAGSRAGTGAGSKIARAGGGEGDNVDLLIRGPNSMGEALVGGLRVPRKRQGELLPP